MNGNEAEGFLFFDADLFVDREPEKKLINDRLSEKQTENKILEFMGIAGQGKTELLKWAYTQAKTRNSHSVYINFERILFQRPEIHPILESITKQISLKDEPVIFFLDFYRLLKNFKDEFFKYQREPFETADRTNVNKLENDVFTAFIEGFERLLAEKQVLLCIDTTEKAYEPAIRQMEEKILKHLVENPNFILIVAGQEKVRWKSIWKHIDHQNLARFSKEATKDFVSRAAKKKIFNIDIGEADKIAEKIWDLTKGHPFGSYMFLDYLNATVGTEITEQVVTEHYSECVESLIDKVIMSRFLENFDIDTSYPKPKEILLSIAPIRRIEFGTFWFALKERLGNYFDGKPMEYFAKLLSELQNKTQIFTPYMLGGIDMDELPRDILISHFRLSMPDEYIQFQESMKRHYEELIAKTRDASQVKNIIEKIYHQIIILGEKDKPEDIEHKITQELEKYLDSYFTKEFFKTDIGVYEQLDRLRRVLEKDKDIKNFINLAPLLQLIEIRANRGQDKSI